MSVPFKSSHYSHTIKNYVIEEINRYMYIPAKSGHVSHTIKNYVLGELKRYIRYNSLKLTFLKIRTKFFSRLRNRGFKKVWLRKHFATLKYEDREKLMAIKTPINLPLTLNFRWC